MKVKPRLIVVAGPNGSGKTTITEKLLRHEWMGGCVYINPDVIAQQEFGGWNSPDTKIRKNKVPGKETHKYTYFHPGKSTYCKFNTNDEFTPFCQRYLI